MTAPAHDPAIREARAGDLAAILAMLRADLASVAREATDPDSCRALFDEIAASANQTLYVAERGAAVVGTFQTTLITALSPVARRRLQIGEVRVRADMRGQGIGTAMMRFAIEAARARGCGLVQLMSDRRRVDAHRFYERLGFATSHYGLKLRLD